MVVYNVILLQITPRLFSYDAMHLAMIKPRKH